MKCFSRSKMRLQIPNLTIALIMIIMTMVSANLNWNSGYWREILKTDGKGYYAYLPAIFIYHDLNLGFYDKIELGKYYNKNLLFDYRVKSNEKIITKYYCGTALVQLPFFLIAHLVSYTIGFATDGYSEPYPTLISVAALFYLLIGLVYLKKTLTLYKIRELNIGFILFAIVFGSDIYYYSVCEPGMSHIYSFAFISMFLYYGKLFFMWQGKKLVIFLSLLLGLITLIRPVNLIIVLILPFLAGNFRNIKSGIHFALKNRGTVIFSLILFFLILFIQLVIYKISTNSFFVYSYKNEGFDLLNPHFVDILFSYKKGLFLYTPIFVISLSGGYFLWKSNKFEFYSLFIFLFLLTYVLSSWNNWWYGGSFSSRVFTEFIPLFSILLGITIETTKNIILKKTFLSFLLCFVILYQIQIYQYRYYQIHWENMTKEKYWDAFLRIDKLIR